MGFEARSNAQASSNGSCRHRDLGRIDVVHVRLGGDTSRLGGVPDGSMTRWFQRPDWKRTNRARTNWPHSASAKDLSLRSLADTTTSTRPRAWRLPGPSVPMSGAACARRACKTSPRYIFRGDQEDEYDGGQTSSLFSEDTSLTRGGIHIVRKWYNEISSVFKDRPPF